MAKFNINSEPKKKVVKKPTKKEVAEKNKQIDTETFTKQEVIDELRKEVKDLVKVESINTIKSLDDFQLKLAKEFAEGATEYEMKRNHSLSSIEWDKLLQTPAFQIEVKRLSYLGSFTEKEQLIRANNRIMSKMYDKLDAMIDKIDDMTPDKYFKMMKEAMELSIKLVGEGNKIIKVDMSQIVNNYIQDKSRVKVLDNGTIDIQQEYPSYDEENDVVLGEYTEIVD